MKRRRWIQLAGAAFGGTLMGCRERKPGGGSGLDDAPMIVAWTAFGTRATIQVAIPDDKYGEDFIERCILRVSKINSVFSLWEPKSELRQLNDHGVLQQPSEDMLRVLELSGKLHQMTDGAFDPTVQPLWDLYESHFAMDPASKEGPPKTEIDKALALVGWDRVDISPERIRVDEGMALTLNGVVQGYATEEVAKLLRENEVTSALVNTGEFQAIGNRPDGSPWRVGVQGANGEEVIDQLDLVDRALAVSAGASTSFDLRERFHHLFHPRGEAFVSAKSVVAVEAPGAGLADGLATACSVMDAEDIERLKPGWSDVVVHQYPAGSG